MKLYELYQDLSYNEFQNLALSEEGSGTIREKDQPKIVVAVNDVMQRLYTRFTIKEGRVRVSLVPGRVRFTLDPQFSVSQWEAGKPDPYILDEVDNPFVNDIAQIIGATNFKGKDVVVNGANNLRGIRTSDTNVFTIQYPDPSFYGMGIEIIYRAGFERIKLPVSAATDEVEIKLPPELIPALKAGVAGHIYGNMNGQEHVAKSTDHWNKYETVCNEVALMDSLSETKSPGHGLFEQRGWV